MRRTPLLVSLVVLFAALAGAPSIGAGQRGAASVAGTWRYAGTPEQGAAIVRQAVDPVVARMRPDMQAIARERIAESTWLPTQIRIGVRGARIEVALRGLERRTFASPLGRVIQVPMRAGQYASLTQTLRDDGGVQQDFVALDGTQRNVYSPRADRTMLLDVTLESPSLPSTIHFQLHYAR